MKKGIALLCVILSAVMLMSAFPVAALRTAKNPFSDISDSDYFYDAVLWAYEERITTGTTATKFSPDSTCTRGQVVTFLWRALGEPEAMSTDIDFSDVKVSDYFYKAVLWAVEKGITNGTGGTKFSPDVTCTNAHILTFIWRAVGEPFKTGVGEWYDDAIIWAKNGGLLDGTYSGEFDPSEKCPRANVVTYLYRYLESGIHTLYVSANNGNDETGDGSAVNPYKTITAARDAVRELDKNKYTAIKVRILEGEYLLTEPIEFTAEDSGKKSCPIYYIGDEGAVISGGVTFDSSAFRKAGGETMKYFPEDVRDELVMIDLKQFGFRAEDVADMITVSRGGGDAPLYMNENKMTVARYPNDGYATVLEDSTANREDGVTTATIRFDAEHTDHVKTWHDISSVLTHARYSDFGRADDSSVLSVNVNENSMTVPYEGEHDPQAGMPFYWYNIPEELDESGEYYIDDYCVLYFYPTEDFASARFTLPTLDDSLIKADGAKYLTLSSLTLESTRQSGITGKGDRLTVKDCTVRFCSDNAISLVGDSIMISGNDIYSIGNTAIKLEGGDADTLRQADSIIYNNSIRNWSTGIGVMNYAVSVGGCGVTVSHNECSDSADAAISYAGPYHLIEYNLCENTCTFVGGCGVISSDAPWAYGTTVRYNHIKNGGYTRDTDTDPVGVHGIKAGSGQSGLTAYGNIIENVTGSGIGISGGRDHSIYGNLMIQCRYGVSYDCEAYTEIKRQGSGNRIDAPGYTENRYWTNAFPVLSRMTFENGGNFDKVITDPNFNASPVSVVSNNVYYLDTAVADKSGEPYKIENYVFDFSKIEVPSDANGMLHEFSSKKTSYDIEEFIKDNPGALAIDVEQFKSIGRITDSEG